MINLPRFYEAGKTAFAEGKTLRQIYATARTLENAPKLGAEKAESYVIGFMDAWLESFRKRT